MGLSPKRTEKSPTEDRDKGNTLVGQLHILGLRRDFVVHWLSSLWWEEPTPMEATASGRGALFCHGFYNKSKYEQRKKATLNTNILTLIVL